MTTRLLIFGTGGHALACLDVIDPEIYAPILVGLPQDLGRELAGLKVSLQETDIDKVQDSNTRTFVGLGHMGGTNSRKDLITRATAFAPICDPLLSKHAIISPTAKIGNGTIVMPGAIIGPGVRIGKNSIVNTGAIIEHGTVIGDNVHISTGVTVNGDCQIAHDTFVGSGSTVANGISISKSLFIKMASRVVENT